jgi:hypothetical protein
MTVAVQPPEPAPIGSKDELREFIAEAMNMARIQAGLGATYAEIGDDVGLHYAARRLAAYTKAILATVADLQAKGAGDAR